MSKCIYEDHLPKASIEKLEALASKHRITNVTMLEIIIDEYDDCAPPLYEIKRDLEETSKSLGNCLIALETCAELSMPPTTNAFTYLKGMIGVRNLISGIKKGTNK